MQPSPRSYLAFRASDLVLRATLMGGETAHLNGPMKAKADRVRTPRDLRRLERAVRRHLNGARHRRAIKALEETKNKNAKQKEETP